METATGVLETSSNRERNAPREGVEAHLVQTQEHHGA